MSTMRQSTIDELIHQETVAEFSIYKAVEGNIFKIPRLKNSNGILFVAPGDFSHCFFKDGFVYESVEMNENIINCVKGFRVVNNEIFVAIHVTEINSIMACDDTGATEFDVVTAKTFYDTEVKIDLGLLVRWVLDLRQSELLVSLSEIMPDLVVKQKSTSDSDEIKEIDYMEEIEKLQARNISGYSLIETWIGEDNIDWLYALNETFGVTQA